MPDQSSCKGGRSHLRRLLQLPMAANYHKGEIEARHSSVMILHAVTALVRVLLARHVRWRRLNRGAFFR